MIGLVVAVLCGTWLIFAVTMGRDVYRKECARIIRRGRQVSDLDRRRAVDKALEMVYAWPFALFLTGYEALITYERTPHSCGDCAAPVLDVIDARPERDGTDELIARLDHEINGMRVTYPDPYLAEAKSSMPTRLEEDLDGYLTLKHGPLNPCPCGYRTECPIHCGSGHTTGRCPSHPEIK